VFIEVKRSHTPPCVTLSGPTEVLNSVSEAGFNVNNYEVVCRNTYVGSSMEIRVTLPRTQALCVVLWLPWPLRGPRGFI
jgi:hypothetical protein